jgi:hypothetical protein
LLYFRPVEFLEQNSYSSLELKIECGAFTNRNDRDGTRSQGEPMKNAYEVLQQKETELARVHHEIESLRIVASLLSEELPSEELTKMRARSAEETLDPGSERATGTDGLFSSINPAPRPRFWNTFKRQK